MTTKEMIDDLKKGTLERMDNACQELFKIIEPINTTRKLKYSEWKPFVENGGLGKAWIQITKIMEAHQYLRDRLEDSAKK